MKALQPGAALGRPTPATASVPARAHAKIAVFPELHAVPAMDIEHINQIGNLLADLSARTDALRGYL
ncbi:MAG: hypothetical protein ACK44A_04035 [Roseateles sp.]